MDEDFDTDVIPGRKARGIDFLVIGLGFVSDVVCAVEQAVDLAQSVVCSHANWLVDREQFHEEAALELESIIEQAPSDDRADR